MGSWPIWNRVTACTYKTDKSYGVRETGDVEVRVGTSKSNSHHLLNHCTTHRKLADGTREYRFYIDGVCVKTAVLHKDGTFEIAVNYLDALAADLS